MHYLAICNIPDGKDAVASSRNEGLLQLHRLLLVRITDQEHRWRSQGLIGWGIVEESHWIFVRLAKLGLESGFQNWSLMFKQNERECLCREYQRGKYHSTIDLLLDWFRIGCMTTDNFCFICKTDKSKKVKQEVNGTVILSTLVFPGLRLTRCCSGLWQGRCIPYQLILN